VRGPSPLSLLFELFFLFEGRIQSGRCRVYLRVYIAGWFPPPPSLISPCGQLCPGAAFFPPFPQLSPHPPPLLPPGPLSTFFPPQRPTVGPPPFAPVKIPVHSAAPGRFVPTAPTFLPSWALFGSWWISATLRPSRSLLPFFSFAPKGNPAFSFRSV